VSQTPTTTSSLVTIARVTLLRLRRGAAIWIGVAIAVLPIVFAVAIKDKWRVVEYTVLSEMLVLSVLPALFVASSIGEEFEARTTTYLWSRPVARWTVLIGKLIALAPLVVLLVVTSWMVAMRLGTSQMPSIERTLGIGAGTIAVAAIAAGIATVVPRHAMALSIIYMAVDFVLAEIPLSIQALSATRQTMVLATQPTTAAAINLAVIAVVWLAIGLVRVRRLEV
jgi:ABC-type transport system involved in multi-copper enzyme maturation permease subunit